MTSSESPIHIALLTPPGRGALAVLGVRGPGAVDLVARCLSPRGGQSLADRPDGAIIFGRWGDPARGEELVVVRHAADWLEIHCHGGFAASEAVLATLTQRRTGFSLSPNKSGFSLSQKPSPPSPRTPSPPLAHSSSPSAAPLSPLRAQVELEARTALARAGGPQAARILCRQLAGGLADELERIAALRAAGDEAAATAAEARLRQASRVGLRLVEPWRVVVSGPVNAGKSSLVNALAGYARSIVSAEPGTTRDVVTTRLVLGGWEIDLIDTAGLREPDEAASATERAGIERALAAAADADLVLQVGQASACQTQQPASPRHSNIRPTPNDSSQQPTLQRDRLKPVLLWTGDKDSDRLKPVLLQGRQAEARPSLRVISKSDLASGVAAPPGAILTSARTGVGIDTLAAAIVAALVPEATADPTLLTGAVPFTPRQLAELEK